jgi:tetratricopeptide (TPR) repeat protein
MFRFVLSPVKYSQNFVGNMKIIRFFFLLCLSIAMCGAPSVNAQDEPRAAWQVTRFDISVDSLNVDRDLKASSRLTVRNVGNGAGSLLSLRLNPKAEVKEVSVGGASATFRSSVEARGNLLRVSINLPSPVAPNGSVDVNVSYRLNVAENSGLAAIAPGASQFLPLSSWYPTANTQFSLRGPDIAPFSLKVNGASIVSSGVQAQRAGGSQYEQALHAQPFFLEGQWETVEGTAAEARGISVWLPKGASADERKQAEAMINLAGLARTFFSGLLGPAPESPVRLIAVARGAGFTDAGTLLLDAAAFRRTKIDSATTLLVAEAVGHLWIGGKTAVRGEGMGALREGLTRYLATLFLEKQFGRETADAQRLRERIAYAGIAKRDAPLALSSPLDATYYSSVTNKGAMVWRLADRALGGDAFINVLRAQLQARANDENGLTLTAFRQALIERSAMLKAVLDQELDQPTDMDLLVGLPQRRGAQWVAALRNTGSVAATITVRATTASGQRLNVETTVPPRGFGEAIFNTTSQPVRVEVDPDKLYPQLDYTNDVIPRTRLSEDALSEAATLFAQQNFARTEAITREILSLASGITEARVLLARSLLAQNKLDEAEKEFRASLDTPAPAPSTLAWANIGLGEISLRKGQGAEAARRFNEAVRVDAEYASTLAARAGRIKAEAAVGVAPQIDESAKAFISQFDLAIKGGRKTEIDALIVPGELTTFVKGIIGSQPETWTTRVLRTEQLDANHVAADVSINTRELGRDQAGTAVLILARVNNNWRLAGIEFFEVR